MGQGARGVVQGGYRAEGWGVWVVQGEAGLRAGVSGVVQGGQGGGGLSVLVVQGGQG